LSKISSVVREIFLADHELEIQTDSNKRHEIETDCAEKESDGLVDEPQNVEYPRSFFSGVILSELGNLKLHVLARGYFVIY
jgi:hypothetical protein|tara:strand:+ start:125 stop:367 length:243 start_codon:yes stop_codon:yes gene_type:complete